MASIPAAHSSHMGLRLGAAEVGESTLYGGLLQYNAKDPTWIINAVSNRNFVYWWAPCEYIF